MKLSAQEEYGLRCLIQIGRNELEVGGDLTISEISQAEGLSIPNVAKLMRILRLGGFVDSARGQAGGYRLSRPADQIIAGDVLAVLGGRLFGPNFCDEHTGVAKLCTHSVDCSVRSLWNAVQFVIDQMLGRISLKDLLVHQEDKLSDCFQDMADEVLRVVPN